MAFQIPTRHEIANQSNANDPSNIPMRFREGGSGFTAFWWNNQVIGWAQNVSHTSPQPVAAPVAIQPLDQPYPLQIMTPAAVGPGTLKVMMFETFNHKVWDRIMNITDTTIGSGVSGGLRPYSQYNDLVDVFVRLAAISKPITCSKIIYPPDRGDRNAKSVYADTFHNCTITDIRDDEQIDIGTMEVIKNLTIQYTFMTRQTYNPNN